MLSSLPGLAGLICSTHDQGTLLSQPRPRRTLLLSQSRLQVCQARTWCLAITVIEQNLVVSRGSGQQLDRLPGRTLSPTFMRSFIIFLAS